jgi:hypothetical protein
MTTGSGLGASRRAGDAPPATLVPGGNGAGAAVGAADTGSDMVWPGVGVGECSACPAGVWAETGDAGADGTLEY